MALRMSMQHETPEPKRSKPGENKDTVGEEVESQELKNRRMQRELMASAAEKRMMAARNAATASAVRVEKSGKEEKSSGAATEGSVTNQGKKISLVKCEGKIGNSGIELSMAEAHQLFSMIFGGEVTKDILAQWSNQGIR